jgi:hypothetical protein
MRTVEAGYRLVNPRLNEWSLCTSIQTPAFCASMV